MNLRERLMDYSLGNHLRLYWRLFRMRERTGSRLLADVLTFFLNRTAHKRGGYIGRGARISGVPSLPHGLHGIYISRYASIGKGCRIYQNVTIGEVNGRAPQIGDGCLIGANAVLVGDIRVGGGARIGAGAVVSFDVPAGATVVAQPPRVITRD
ncbi:MAG: serine acetyltransferase [Oscillibacter sp.]|nr:serine acetyltransferase [Oscillibacter sp.]